MSLTAAASATTSSAALRALAERIQSLGLLRNERLRLVTGVGLALFGISALRRASDRRSQAKLNNCTKDTYDWPHEIVVVTGGSGGLGAPLVEKFAALGATVISLDITPPKAPLRMMLLHQPSRPGTQRLTTLDQQRQMPTSIR